MGTYLWVVVMPSGRLTPEQQRFLSHVKKENGHWLWQGAKVAGRGYGMASNDGKAVRAHKRAYELFKGPVPAGKDLLHTCDIRDCCNPAHVKPGTQKQNSKDMVAKGRNPISQGQGKGSKPRFNYPKAFRKGSSA